MKGITRLAVLEQNTMEKYIKENTNLTNAITAQQSILSDIANAHDEAALKEQLEKLNSQIEMTDELIDTASGLLQTYDVNSPMAQDSSEILKDIISSMIQSFNAMTDEALDKGQLDVSLQAFITYESNI